MAEEREEQVTEKKSITYIEKSQETTQTISVLTSQPAPAAIAQLQLPEAPADIVQPQQPAAVQPQLPAATTPIDDVPVTRPETDELEFIGKISKLCNAEKRKRKAEKPKAQELPKFIGTGSDGRIACGHIGNYQYAFYEEERSVTFSKLINNNDGKQITRRLVGAENYADMTGYIRKLRGDAGKLAGGLEDKVAPAPAEQQQPVTLKKVSTTITAVKMVEKETKGESSESLVQKTETPTAKPVEEVEEISIAEMYRNIFNELAGKFKSQYLTTDETLAIKKAGLPDVATPYDAYIWAQCIKKDPGKDKDILPIAEKVIANYENVSACADSMIEMHMEDLEKKIGKQEVPEAVPVESDVPAAAPEAEPKPVKNLSISAQINMAEKNLKDDEAYFRKISVKDKDKIRELEVNYSEDMGIICINSPEGQEYVRRVDGVRVDAASKELPGKKPYDFQFLDEIVAAYNAAGAQPAGSLPQPKKQLTIKKVGPRVPDGAPAVPDVPAASPASLYDLCTQTNWSSDVKHVNYYGRSQLEASIAKVDSNEVINLDGKFYAIKQSEKGERYFNEITPEGEKGINEETYIKLNKISPDESYFDGEYAHAPSADGTDVAYMEGSGSTLFDMLGKPITVDVFGGVEKYTERILFYRKSIASEAEPNGTERPAMVKVKKGSFRDA